MHILHYLYYYARAATELYTKKDDFTLRNLLPIELWFNLTYLLIFIDNYCT